MKYSRKTIGIGTLLVVCVFFLLNPLFGIIEPIPDNFPLIGNVDEIIEVLLIIWFYPRLKKRIAQERAPKPVKEGLWLDNQEYINVKAEVLDRKSD